MRCRCSTRGGLLGSALLLLISQSDASIFADTNRTIGDRCRTTGLFQRSCAEGLTCMPSPVPLGGSQCFPLDCLATAANEFSAQVNITDYQEFVFDQAGVTTEQFYLQGDFGKAYLANLSSSSPAGSTPTATPYSTSHRLGLRSFGRSSCNANVVRAMLTSPYVAAVMQAIADHPIPPEPWQAYEAAIAQCDPDGKLTQKDVTSFFGPTTPGVLGTVGFGAGAGVGLGAGVEFFFSFPNEQGPIFFIDLGGGLFLGADIGVSVSMGMVFTGEPEDIPGVGFEIDLVVPTPFVGPGVSVGLDLGGVWDLSFFVNGGIGLSIGAFNAGYTWGF